jgi:CcmD family protein
MRPIRIALLALLALFAAPSLRAQAPAGETATAAAAAAAQGAPVSAAVPAPADAPGSAPPVRYTPPRTLRAYAHVFAAFTVAWLLLFGYVFYLGRKFRHVEEQVAALARS